MTFEEILDQAIALLQRRGRLTYRTLKRQFELDDAALEDLKEELIYGQRLAVDEEERVLVWMGDTAASRLRPPDAPRPSTPARHVLPSPTRRRIWPRKSSPPAVPWKASASRSPCCLPTSKAPWNCWPTATRRRPGSSSIPCWNA